jgi:plastocyanin domain-containing protein
MKSMLMSVVVAVTLGAVACKKDPPAARAPAPAAAEVTAPADGRVAITVDGEGYHPATIRAAAGRPLTLVFTRTTDETCGQQVLFPSKHTTHDLPLNRPVEVAVTAPATGALAFTCAMNMYQGSVVAQ